MYAKNKTPVLILAMVITLGVVGCGGSDVELPFLEDLVPATGLVTLNGEPLSGATVIFSPGISAEGGRMATAVTDESGAYELITRVPGMSEEQTKGALPGEYVVSLSLIAMPDGAPFPEGLTDEGEAISKGAKQLVPAKYTDMSTSTLKATVASPKAENDFKL